MLPLCGSTRSSEGHAMRLDDDLFAGTAEFAEYAEGRRLSRLPSTSRTNLSVT
jgi:hypothetical protein